MGDNSSKAKTEKKGFFKSLKSEFKKIMWPSKETVFKKSFAVILVTAILSILIAVLDYVVKTGLDILL